MALTPDTDQFSQFLRLAFLRSPNFATGVSGWTINQDGSAEFNNLTIRGTFKGTNFIINASGAFFYSGIPANGNLIASIASANGTDQFGNAFLAGVNSYSSGIAGELFSAALRFVALSNPASSPPTVFTVDASSAGARVTLDSGKGTVAATRAVITLADSLLGHSGVAQGVVGTAASPITGFTTALWEVQGTLAANLLVAIVSGAAETWHTIAPVAGFSASSPTPRYQLEPINGGRVRLSGVVNLTANQVAGTTFFTLPAGYVPAQNHFFAAYNTLSGYTAGGKSVQVNSTGQIQVGSGGSNGNFMQLDGIVFELD